MKSLLKYLYRLSRLVVSIVGACFLLILIAIGLGRIVNPTANVQLDFTAITSTGYTYFWATVLITYVVGSAVWILYHFIKNDNQEDAKNEEVLSK